MSRSRIEFSNGRQDAAAFNRHGYLLVLLYDYHEGFLGGLVKAVGCSWLLNMGAAASEFLCLPCHYSFSCHDTKAYISMRRKTLRVVVWRWVTPPTREFCIRYTNMLVSRNVKTPDAKPKICVTPTQNPNASQWNIGCVGYQTQHFRVGHVHFMFFVLISFAFVSQRKPSFQWNMGLRPMFTSRATFIIFEIPSP